MKVHHKQITIARKTPIAHIFSLGERFSSRLRLSFFAQDFISLWESHRILLIMNATI